MASLEHGQHPITRVFPMKDIPLVNRVEEMNVLKEAVYKAVHGEGGLVFIHGEGGIGKTRLLRELGAYAQSRGVRVLYGRCPALFGMNDVAPYTLWKEVIKDYLETCTPEQLFRVVGYYPAEVAKLVPEINQKLRAIPQSFTISQEQEQTRLFEAISQFVTNISQETPLLLILDDLQWTDPSSLLLLHYLARGVQKTALLLLGAYRSTDVDDKHPLTPVLTELNRERLRQLISLKRMSLGDICELIRNILEQEDVPEEFCTLVYEKTKGNPFFVEEVIRSLKEDGVISREENQWKISEVSKIEFPETVKSIIKARIGRLDNEQQNVLTMASIVGNDFTFEALHGVTDLNEDKLRKIIDGLLKAGLFKHKTVRGEGVCYFSDTVVRNVVYEEIGTYECKKLHEVVGKALEKVYAEKIDDHLGELASHFLESGDTSTSFSYFSRAGKKAMKVFANIEAISYYQSASKLLEEKEDEYQEKAYVFQTLGDLKKAIGEYDLCIKYWNEASWQWKQLGEKEKVAGLYRKIAATLWREVGKKEEASDNFEKALKILETEPESIELAALYSARANMAYFTEDVMKARSLGEKALELGQKLNASEVIASSCVDLGLVFGAIGEKEKAIEYNEMALKIALDNGYVDIALRSYNNVAAQLPAEENERILDCYEKGLELAKKAGHVHGISWLEGQLALRYLWMGNIEKARTLAEECRSLGMKIGNLLNLASSTAILGFAYHILGEWDKGEEYLEESANISQKANNTRLMSNCYGFLGWSYYDKGEYAKADECFEKTSRIHEKTGTKAYQISDYVWIAMNCLELGETNKARTLLDALNKFALEKHDKQLIAEEHAIRAMLLRVEKKWNESIELFERSLQEYEAIGGRKWYLFWLAKIVLYEYSRVYSDRNQAGDSEKALKLLNEALGIFRKMGARKDIGKLEAGIASIETGKVISKPKPIEHVSTGYANLDKLLQGGIPPNYAVVLTSTSCDERDLLVRSFLGIGTKKGEVTFHVTINAGLAKALAEKFQPNLQLFVCNPEAEAIIRSLPNVHTLKGVENLTDISIALTSAMKKLDPSRGSPRRICIGLISDILLQHHAVETRRWLTALLTKLKSEDFTIMAIVDPKMHPSEELHAILGLFEGEINIYEKETEKGVERFLKIRRMSYQKYLEDELSLKDKDPR